MKEQITPRRWKDPEGNVYAVEKAVRNGRFLIIRYNPGGNRKAAKQFSVVGSAPAVQKHLDGAAVERGWVEAL
jgi:hypothetical protein